jgi:hypothetical protein
MIKHKTRCPRRGAADAKSHGLSGVISIAALARLVAPSSKSRKTPANALHERLHFTATKHRL